MALSLRLSIVGIQRQKENILGELIDTLFLTCIEVT